MKIRKILAGAAIGVLGTATAWSATITSIDFKQAGNQSILELKSDEALQVEQQNHPEDKQVVLEIKGAKLGKGQGRKLDTSSFNSRVNLVSPYEVDGGNVKVVVQLRETADATLKQEGNLIQLSVPNPGTAAATEAPSAPEPAQPATSQAAEAAPAPQAAAQSTAQAATPATPASPATEPTMTIGEKALEEFSKSSETKNYVGKPITLEVRDADAQDVFRLIGEASGFNLMIGDAVRGKLTLSLKEVPWDQVLDMVLQTMKLGAERNNNILRIDTLTNLTNEKRQQLDAKRAAEATAPKITRVFPISYAKPSDLSGLLSAFATGSPSAGGANDPAANQLGASNAVVRVDERTNAIIVQGIPEQVERIRRLIKVLDTQTPQVLIEGKVIEASETFAKNIAGSLGVGGQGAQVNASFNGGDPTAASLASSLSTASGKGGSFGFSPNLGFLSGPYRINALLTIGEGESQAKTITSPRVVVLNKQSATITQGTPVLIPTTTISGSGPPVQSFTTQSANVSLNVTPTVTNEGSILLQLNLSRDSVQVLTNGSAVANRNMTTQVLVDNGQTLVLGGVYSYDQSHAEDGFPILRKIPLLGALFGSNHDSNNRSELFFFVTPRILNEKESGLSPGNIDLNKTDTPKG